MHLSAVGLRNNLRVVSGTALLMLAAAGGVPPSAGAEAPASALRVAELERPVSLSAGDRPLRECLTALSRQAGCTLRAAESYEDRALTLHVRTLPAHRVLAAISRLYGDPWERTTRAGKPVYTLRASTARVTRQRHLLALHDQVGHEALLARCRSVAQNGTQAPRPEPDDRLERQMRARGQLITRMPPDALARVLTGDRVRFHFVDIPGAFGDELRRFITEFATPHFRDAAAEEAWRAGAFAEFGIRETANQNGVPVFALEFVTGTARTGANSGYNLVAPGEDVAARMRRLDDLILRDERSSDALALRKLPALERKVPATNPFVTGQSSERGKLALELAGALRLSLVSDSHIKRAETIPPLAGRTAADALDEISRAFGCYWKAGEVVTLRSRHWWKDDLDDPPATQLARWEGLIDRNGSLTLEEALPMAWLSPAQHERLVRRIPTAEGMGRGWFRFYSRLSPQERRLATGEAGLRMSALPRERRQEILWVPHVRAGMGAGGQDYETLVLQDPSILKVTESETLEPNLKIQIRDVSFALTLPPGVLTKLNRITGHGVTVRLPYRLKPRGIAP